jgi:hypothetical protein
MRSASKAEYSVPRVQAGRSADGSLSLGLGLKSRQTVSLG